MKRLATDHKRGDTFGRLVTVLFGGQPVDLSAATVTSQVRTPDGTLVDDLTVDMLDAAQGQVEIYKLDTTAWPLSDSIIPLLCDVKVVQVDTNRTTTFEIHVVPQVTA